MSTKKKPARENNKILDAWAIVAWLKGEKPASDRVQSALDDAESGRLALSINVVNLGEIYYLIAKTSSLQEADEFMADFRSMPVKVLPSPNSLVLAAASIKARHAVSYADAFAAATAMRFQAPLLTGDPELKTFLRGGGPAIDWIGAL